MRGPARAGPEHESGSSTGEWPSGKAPDSGSGDRRFDSFRPSQPPGVGFAARQPHSWGVSVSFRWMPGSSASDWSRSTDAASTATSSSRLATCAAGRRSRSKAYRDRYGLTPLSPDEKIPWSASRLIVGTGASGQLPIMPELYQEAQRRGVEVVALPTEEACRLLSGTGWREAAAVIHVTC